MKIYTNIASMIFFASGTVEEIETTGILFPDGQGGFQQILFPDAQGIEQDVIVFPDEGEIAPWTADRMDITADNMDLTADSL